MSVVNILKKGIGKAQLVEDQLLMSRSIVFLTILLYALHTIQDIASGEYLQWSTSANYIYFKFAVLICLFIFLVSTFLSPKVKAAFLKLNLWIYLAIFYIIALSTFVEGVDWQNEFFLLTISLLIYTGYLKNTQFIIYTILSNAMLILLHFVAPAKSTNSDFLVMHLIATLGLLLIRVVRIRSDESMIEVDLFFEDILNSLRDAVFLVTPVELKAVFTNHATDRIFGTAINSVLKLVAPESQNTFTTAVHLITDFRGSWEGEIGFLDKTGKHFDSLVTLSSFKISSDDLLFLKVADISKLKAAQQQLKTALIDVQEKNTQLESSKRAIMNILEDVVSERSEAVTKQKKLTAVLESIAEGVVVMDQERKIYMFNDAALKMIGCTAADLNSKIYTDILHFQFENSQGASEDFIEKVYRGELGGRIFNLLLVRSNNELLPVSVTTSPVLNEQNQITRVVVVFRDDTAQRKIDRMRSEFVSVTSHQLRTPLTSIKWYTELITDPATGTNLTESQKKYLQQIDASNSRMIALVNDLLNVSRIETGTNFDMKLEPTDIVKLIRDVVDEQMVIANQRLVSVNYDINELTELILNIDTAKIRQVIMNILSNAIKYSSENNTVALKWYKDDQNFYLEVQDHGIGIPKDEQERVFEKFFRAANAVSKQTEGTGLGTYISRSIARAHGGDVTFISEEGKGSTFTLQLPLQIVKASTTNLSDLK